MGEFAKMAEQLARIRGTFLLSLNDPPEVRAIFGAFSIEAVRTTYSVGGAGKAKAVGEVIIPDRPRQLRAKHHRVPPVGEDV